MKITFIPLTEAELEQAYRLYKEALYPFIDTAFGWDELFQQARFQSAYKLEWFFWVEIESTRKALVCAHLENQVNHIHLLIVLPAYRSQGTGKAIMAHYHAEAKRTAQSVALSSFKNNIRAVNFYLQMSYEVIGEDEHFIDLSYRQ